MSFTTTDVINRARLIWRETASGDILSDANCLLWLSDGYLLIRSIRPEVKKDSNGDEIDYADVAAVETTINLPDKFRPVLTDYLVARGFDGDSDSQNHGERANQHFKLFETMVKAV